jgi:signal peptidase
MGKKWVVGTIELLVVLGVVAVIVGQVVGQPVLIGFVISGSMQPTLAPGDGFVVIPSVIAGDIHGYPLL